jgi:hypothetical protein
MHTGGEHLADAYFLSKFVRSFQNNYGLIVPDSRTQGSGLVYHPKMLDAHPIITTTHIAAIRVITHSANVIYRDAEDVLLDCVLGCKAVQNVTVDSYTEKMKPDKATMTLVRLPSDHAEVLSRNKNVDTSNLPFGLSWLGQDQIDESDSEVKKVIEKRLKPA